MLTTITHRAMAAEFAVILPHCEAHRTEDAFEALELLDQIEAELTVYRPSSVISQINSTAHRQSVQVSAELFELLQRSLAWSKRTEGAFDITAGPLVKAWGFTQRRGKKPSEQAIAEALDRCGYRHVKLERDTRSVRLEKPGMELNLGAIGKGYALDRLAGELIDRGLKHFLLHGGGSSILARGDQEPARGDQEPARGDQKPARGQPEPSADEDAKKAGYLVAERRRGWAVGLSHPTKPNVRLAGFRLIDEALSTSGSGKQFFHFRGRRYGHVIDPRTGYPAGDMLSLTAVADNATDAEACSTACFVLGSENVQAMRDSESLLPRMVGITPTARQDSVEVRCFGEFSWVDPPPQNTHPRPPSQPINPIEKD
jgi:thiamine biosynthesis lipoprotein